MRLAVGERDQHVEHRRRQRQQRLRIAFSRHRYGVPRYGVTRHMSSVVETRRMIRTPRPGSCSGGCRHAASGACSARLARGARPAFPPTPVDDRTGAARRRSRTRPSTSRRSSRCDRRPFSRRSTGRSREILVKSGDRVRAGRAARCRSIRAGSRRRCRARRPSAPPPRRPSPSRGSSSSAPRELFAAGAISKQETEQAETALRTAEANLQALQAQVQQQQVQLRYFTVAAPTAGIVGDVPVRVGNQVTTQTVLTTIDQNDTLEVYVSVPIERAPALEAGLPIQILEQRRRRALWRRRPSTSSRRTWTTRRSRCWSRARCRTRTATLRVVAVRARADRLEDRRRAGRAGDRGAPHQRPVLRVRRRGRGRQAGRRNSARSRSVRSSATTIRCSTGIKPGERVVVSGAQKLADGAPISAAGRDASPTAIGHQP